MIIIVLMMASITGDTDIVYKPHPGPQTWFHESQADILAFGGARGPGKTIAGLFEATRYMHCPDYKALVSRRTYPQLSEIISRAHKYFPKLGYQWRAGDKTYVSPEGGVIKFMSFKDEKNVENVVGHEYQYLFIDQVEQFTRYMIEIIETCVRSSIPGIPARIRYTSNPGSIGHLDFKERFVDKCRPIAYGDPVYIPQFDITYQPILPGEPFRDENGLLNHYIPSRVFDNPTLFLNDPKYVRRLMNLPEKLRQAHLMGDYDSFVGQFFDMWNHDIHVIEPFEIPLHWRIFGGYDWGYAKPACYHHIVISENGDMFLTREFYEAGKGLEYHAERIKTIDRPMRDQIRDRLADPSIWDQKANPDYRKDKRDKPYPTDDTIEMILRKLGVDFLPANNNRVSGWTAMREALEYRNARKRPALRIFSNCVNAIRTIPAMVHDSTKPEDMDTTIEDHSCDVIRYILMGIEKPVIPKDKPLTWQDVVRNEGQKKSGRVRGVVRYS